MEETTKKKYRQVLFYSEIAVTIISIAFAAYQLFEKDRISTLIENHAWLLYKRTAEVHQQILSLQKSTLSSENSEKVLVAEVTQIMQRNETLREEAIRLVMTLDQVKSAEVCNWLKVGRIKKEDYSRFMTLTSQGEYEFTHDASKAIRNTCAFGDNMEVTENNSKDVNKQTPIDGSDEKINQEPTNKPAEKESSSETVDEFIHPKIVSSSWSAESQGVYDSHSERVRATGKFWPNVVVSDLQFVKTISLLKEDNIVVSLNASDIAKLAKGNIISFKTLYSLNFRYDDYCWRGRWGEECTPWAADNTRHINKLKSQLPQDMSVQLIDLKGNKKNIVMGNDVI